MTIARKTFEQDQKDNQLKQEKKQFAKEETFYFILLSICGLVVLGLIGLALYLAFNQ